MSPKQLRPKKIYKKIIYLLPTGFLVFIYQALGKENVNVDQFLWYERTESFFQAFTEGDFASTYQKYHPGVLLMYLIRAGQLTYKWITKDVSRFKDIFYLNFPAYNFWTKFYLVTFVFVLIIISAFFLYKISKSKLLSLGFLIILLSEPYFLGNLRNLHLDTLSSVLIACSVLIFYAGLCTKKPWHFALSGITTGLGLLTKSICLSIIVVNFTMIIYFFIRNAKDRIWLLKMFSLFFVVSLFVFILLFPAMWTAPLDTLSRVVNEGILKTGLEGKDNFTHHIRGVPTDDPGFAFYPLVFKYRLSLFIQLSNLLFIFYLAYLFFKKGKRGFKNLLFKSNYSYPLFLVFLALYITGYIAIFTYSAKKTDRYITTLFPLLAVLSASFIYYVNKITDSKNFLRVFNVAVGLIFTTTLIANISIHPYYFAYYNPFLGGLESARDEMYLNQGGIGVYEMAQYLNSSDIGETDLIGATNYEEIGVFSKHKVEGFSNDKMDEYDYVILTMQRDRQFKQDRETVKLIKIFGSDYLRISRKED